MYTYCVSYIKQSDNLLNGKMFLSALNGADSLVLVVVSLLLIKLLTKIVYRVIYLCPIIICVSKYCSVNVQCILTAEW